jgi:cytochrome bd-type quinol oxidase subunit 2
VGLGGLRDVGELEGVWSTELCDLKGAHGAASYSAAILARVQPFVTAGTGFLLCVLWFDLMFDVQVLKHRGHGAVREEVLASIAGYYRRVTRAMPMNRLVAVVMLGTVAAIVAEIAGDDTEEWAAWASLILVVPPIVLAFVHTFPLGARLGSRRDPVSVQSALARSICRDHLLCLAAIVPLLVIQLAFAG